MNVAILGASAKPDRMSHMAQQRLVEHGHTVFPVSPVYDEILGIKTFKSLSEITEPIDTLTMYVSSDKQSDLLQDILELKPKRVIFNPGSENQIVIEELEKANIRCMEACTLVMLSASSF